MAILEFNQKKYGQKSNAVDAANEVEKKKEEKAI